MKTDEYKTLKDKFFLGQTSEQEEKFLKEDSNEPYFSFLKDEKAKELDLDFEDFISNIKINEQPKHSRVTHLRKVWWAVAAVFILGVGLFYLTKQFGEKSVRQEITVNKKDNFSFKKPKSDWPKTDISHPVLQDANHKLVDHSVRRTRVIEPKKSLKKESKIENVAIVKNDQKNVDENNDYHPSYVMVNGKPIYDEEEAKNITINSLNTLASNVEKGIESVETIKNIEIKF